MSSSIYNSWLTETESTYNKYHNLNVSFNEKTNKVNIGESKTFTDSNGILNSYPTFDKTINGIEFKHTQGSNDLVVTANKNGKYATTGGHPKSGESSIQGILTDVEEEIGLKLNPDNLRLYYSGKSEEGRAFWDDYYIKLDVEDIKKLKLQDEEVEAVEWFSKTEIIELMKQDKFFKNHYEKFEILIDWLKKK